MMARWIRLGALERSGEIDLTVAVEIPSGEGARPSVGSVVHVRLESAISVAQKYGDQSVLSNGHVQFVIMVEIAHHDGTWAHLDRYRIRRLKCAVAIAQQDRHVCAAAIGTVHHYQVKVCF